MSARDFPALQRRLRWLSTEIGTIEHHLDAESVQHTGRAAMPLYQAYLDEMSEIDYLLRYYYRQTNGVLSRTQWVLVLTSVLVSGVLLCVFALEVVR